MTLFPDPKHFEWLQPFAAVGATAMGDQKFGRFRDRALDPVAAGLLSGSERWAEGRSWLPSSGEVPRGGLIATCSDPRQGDQWRFMLADGFCFSPDGRANITSVMNDSGSR